MSPTTLPMKIATLSKVSQARALNHISEIEMKGSGSWSKPYYIVQHNVKIPNSEYLEKIMSYNMLYCYRCLEPINIGDKYQYKSKKCRITKYYHYSCYEDMYQ